MLTKSILLTAVTVILFLTIKPLQGDAVIIDSDMTFDEAIAGSKAPSEVIDNLVLLNLKYYSVDGKIHQGQLVVSKEVQKDIEEIFAMMLDEKFVIEKMIPIVKYGWSDNKSMEDNNTSAFNYRYIAGTKRLSNHSFGRAVDINPRWNPVIHKDGHLSPQNGSYDTSRPGTFYAKHPIVVEFKKRGWRWGGDFKRYKDNHHFDLPK
jgi:hypothetical protein